MFFFMAIVPVFATVDYAVFVGVSDYQYVNDLCYCDNDAWDLYRKIGEYGGKGVI